MTDTDLILTELVRELIAMPRPDREYVLRQLSDDEARLLAPHLAAIATRPLSLALLRLAGDCAGEQLPDGIRPRAVAAIRSAVAAASPAGEPLTEGHAAPRASVRARAADFLAGR